MAVGVATYPFVIAGLDPAIHLFRKMMDARVKPAHDRECLPPVVKWP